VEGAQPISNDIADLILHKTWKPTLCITGVDGIPSLEKVLSSFCSPSSFVSLAHGN
jgi:hypothetical protein